MKKIFTLIAAALMTAGAYADEVVLWENVTDGQVLTIADIEAAGGADAFSILKVECNDICWWC